MVLTWFQILWLTFFLLICESGSAFQGNGCMVFGNNAGSFVSNLIEVPSSGDPYLDKCIREESVILKEFFKVQCKVFYFDDSSSPNAYAINSPNGYFVAIGTNQLALTLRNQSTGVGGATGLIAHEFGHIYQFTQRLQEKYQTKFMELHADYLAGIYVSSKSDKNFSFQFQNSSFLNGSMFFSNTDTHGTKTERLTAATEGLLHFCRWVISNNGVMNNFPTAQFVKSGIDFLSSNTLFRYPEGIERDTENVRSPEEDQGDEENSRTICPVCNGSKKVDCQRCEGTGEIECRVCKGTGVGKCPGCNGYGKNICARGPCFACQNTGYLFCWDCNGRGTDGVCSSCGGSGRKDCPKSGCISGKVKCSECSGTGYTEE